MIIKNIDDKLIDEVLSLDEVDMLLGKRNKNNKVLKIVVSIAASVAVFAVVLIGIFFSNSSTVIYADTVNDEYLFYDVPEEKVCYESDFSCYSDNTKVRIMILMYDMREAYPEIYNRPIAEYGNIVYSELLEHFSEQDERGTIEWNDITRFMDDTREKVAHEEKRWLKEVGAEELVQISDFAICCTMNVKQLEKLNEGKCKYRVILSTKEYELEKSIIDLFGQHKSNGYAYWPLYLGVTFTVPLGQEPSGLTYDLYFNDDELTFTGIGDDNNYFDFSIDNPIYELDEYSAEIFGLGLNKDVYLGLGIEAKKDLSRKNVIYKVRNTIGSQVCRIIINSENIYLDIGNAIFRFDK